MMSLDNAKRHLQNSTLTIVKDGNVHTYNERGIKTLLTIMTETPDLLSGASVADKIVGKAAALLMIKGGVKEVYAEVVSEGAIDIFRKYRVLITYGKITAHIINRSGTGICPMEQTVQNIDEPNAAYKALKQKQILLVKKEA